LFPENNSQNLDLINAFENNSQEFENNSQTRLLNPNFENYSQDLENISELF
jgi:hypothetical protein